MSTVTEIEQAIGQLSLEDRDLLESRLMAHRFGLNTLSEDEHRDLLTSLEESRKEGGRFTADQIRAELPLWLGK